MERSGGDIAETLRMALGGNALVMGAGENIVKVRRKAKFVGFVADAASGRIIVPGIVGEIKMG